ncbi:hypothetical protein ACIBI4_17795 [Streptomyces sp. NPDC050418]|uniref:hypothetical protein n=1 Tax=Streptomyces sp. NPDC050418 TaxID=3365612 RepID=UPI00379E2017
MGSLRNPIGPLPSSIYWRRRAVLLTVLGLLALLIVWAVSGGGGGGNGGEANGKNPAPSITPGPDQSGPAISEQPGGRDESGDGGSSSGEDSGGSGEDGGGSGSGEDSGGTEGSNGAGGGPGSAGSGSGEQLPAGSSLPTCRPGDLDLTVKSEKNRYEVGEKPKLEITAKNSAGSDCKIDLGPKELVVSITRTGDDEAYWKSSHCPATAGSLLYRVPADSAITYTLTWDRRPSAPDCASPAPGSAAPDTYLVEVKGAGADVPQVSFVIEEA